MAEHVSGTFDITSQDRPYDEAEGARLMHATGHKVFRGGIEGTSRVELIKAVAAVPGSAAYVGLERVVGAVGGRAGSFVLRHTGLMDRGDATLEVTVVPDTGTGDLTGIAGRMTITVVDGHHDYTFEYSLPSSSPA
ncbi:DUF3224 domain-containing protein [Dactylosporangium sp. CA-052675]|uniref:DUF3224 domain-containing protein n=1 Tax=Dactylosporangium sp. CA-052675 TaxID=3239927 RepID=UPI003D933443